MGSFIRICHFTNGGERVKHDDVVKIIEGQNKLKGLAPETSMLAIDYAQRIENRKQTIRQHQETIRRIEYETSVNHRTIRALTESEIKTVQHCQRWISEASKKIRNYKATIERMGYDAGNEDNG